MSALYGSANETQLLFTTHLACVTESQIHSIPVQDPSSRILRRMSQAVCAVCT
ncbi:predicted protein [Plenodomus lingam JN3]|uniref:Predicted protein n=1 Tax=Leptosphaeria maculans (strain JN3 / isolate v23.1.3 / race Av1-4-5-6-7-8) TaxID=985895 RepID=E4ZZX6_LEPMJ|nr:predicted protein [Plenodomus lingam JN3]CBX96836.1 predicted protein [Plenodomus lingam JN3]